LVFVWRVRWTHWDATSSTIFFEGTCRVERYTCCNRDYTDENIRTLQQQWRKGQIEIDWLAPLIISLYVSKISSAENSTAEPSTRDILCNTQNLASLYAAAPYAAYDGVAWNEWTEKPTCTGGSAHTRSRPLWKGRVSDLLALSSRPQSITVPTQMARYRGDTVAKLSTGALSVRKIKSHEGRVPVRSVPRWCEFPAKWSGRIDQHAVHRVFIIHQVTHTNVFVFHATFPKVKVTWWNLITVAIDE